VHHVGLAVEDLDGALDTYERLFGARLEYRSRVEEQARLTDGAYEVAVRLLRKHRAPLDRIAAALLEKETLIRDELQALVEDVEAESRAGEAVGVPQVVASEPGELPS